MIGFVGSGEPLWKGIFYAVLMFATASLQSLLLSAYFQRMYIVGMRIRTCLISAIYRKVRLASRISPRVCWRTHCIFKLPSTDYVLSLDRSSFP